MEELKDFIKNTKKPVVTQLMSIDDPSKDLEDGKTAVSWPIGLNNSEVITVIERIYDVYEDMVSETLRDNTPEAVRKYH